MLWILKQHHQWIIAISFWCLFVFVKITQSILNLYLKLVQLQSVRLFLGLTWTMQFGIQIKSSIILALHSQLKELDFWLHFVSDWIGLKMKQVCQQLGQVRLKINCQQRSLLFLATLFEYYRFNLVLLLGFKRKCSKSHLLIERIFQVKLKSLRMLKQMRLQQSFEVISRLPLQLIIVCLAVLKVYQVVAEQFLWFYQRQLVSFLVFIIDCSLVLFKAMQQLKWFVR